MPCRVTELPDERVALVAQASDWANIAWLFASKLRDPNATDIERELARGPVRGACFQKAAGGLSEANRRLKLTVPSWERERVENDDGTAAEKAPWMPVFRFQLLVFQNRFVGAEECLGGGSDGFGLFPLENCFIENEAFNAEDAEGNTQSYEKSPPHRAPPDLLSERY
jgi:hypothetical protein